MGSRLNFSSNGSGVSDGNGTRGCHEANTCVRIHHGVEVAATAMWVPAKMLVRHFSPLYVG